MVTDGKVEMVAQVTWDEEECQEEATLDHPNLCLMLSIDKTSSCKEEPLGAATDLVQMNRRTVEFRMTDQIFLYSFVFSMKITIELCFFFPDFVKMRKAFYST